jgi:hypothetical protein
LGYGVRYGRLRARSWPRWLSAAGIVLAVNASMPGVAPADSPPNPSGPLPVTPESRAADALFEQLLKEPKNVDLTFRYAEASIKAGNIEAGISSLERLLLLDRNFPGIKLELAELYSRLHSYDMARSYLAQAEQEPALDANALARIQAVRAEVEKANSPSQFSTNLLVGLRHQSDASAEPAGSEIIAGGVPQTLSSIYIHHPGWDTFVTGNLQHVYNFGNVQLESNVLVYYSKALGHSDLDLGALEVNSGPRFNVDFGDTHFFSARPYVVANEVTLGENQFLHSAGAGIAADRSLIETLSGSAFYEFRSEWFSNVALSPAADAGNADVHSFGIGLGYNVVEDGDLSFQVSYALTDDFGSVGSNKGLVFHLAYSQLFQLPAALGVGPLNVSPTLYRIYSRDDGPNLAVNMTTLGSTNEWRYGLTGKLGLTNNIAANFNVIRQTATSDIAANRTQNTQLIIGAVFSY